MSNTETCLEWIVMLMDAIVKDKKYITISHSYSYVKSSIWTKKNYFAPNTVSISTDIFGHIYLNQFVQVQVLNILKLN